MAKGITVDLIVDPKKAIEGIGQVESKASGAAESLSRLGGVAGAAIVGLSAVAVAGAVALGSAVVSAYSDYEQLAGGVQKLFGDASATVSAFAANAAASAGLSTNQYMDTVTSFSAALISGLGGDQEAAAQAANVAITDMADNANTFGTSLDSIQLAYQGFAKGNFALLDNLKLGFGGSQQGMADLINTSGVLGDSMTVTAQTVKDVPFDKMIEAIHQVQAGMGIAGATAKEAASTIAGSFDATKASLDNLVIGLGSADSDFDTLVGSLATNAQNLVTNVAPVIGRLAEAIPQVVPVLLSAVQEALPAVLPLAANLITALLTGLVDAAPSLVEGAIPIILSLVAGILGALPSIIAAGAKIIVSLVKGVASALPTLIPAAIEAVLGLVTALIENLPLLLDAGLQLITGLVTGIVQAIPTIIAALPGIIVGIITFLIDAIPTLIDAGLQLFLSLVDALPQIITGIVAAIPKIIVGIITAVISSIPALIAGGIKLFVGLIGALPQIITSLVGAVPQIIQGLVKAFTDPKTLKQLGDAGVQLIRGLWEGIKGAGDWLWRQLKGFFGGIITNIKNLLGIHSPSTVFAGFGKYMILGLEKGLTGPNHVGSIVSDLSKQVASGLGGEINVRARTSAVGVAGGGSGAAAASTPSAAPALTQNVYVLPEQDPRVLGRQLGREFLRASAGQG